MAHKTYPRGFRPRGNGGIRVPKQCPGCLMPETKTGWASVNCPGVELIGHAFSVKHAAKNGRPLHEPTAQFIAEKHRQQGEQLDCLEKPLMVEGMDDMFAALGFYRRSKEA